MSSAPVRSVSVVVWDDEARDKLIEKIRAMRIDMSQPIVVTVEYVDDPISQDQRGYYQSAIVPAVCEHSGYKRWEAHEFLKRTFGPLALYEIGSRKTTLPTITTGANGSRRMMSAYLDEILHWGDEEGIYIPPPRTKSHW